MKPVKICFISLRSYPLFSKDSNDYFGGAEVQMTLIARELAKDKDFKVSLITGNYSQPSLINHGRLTLFKTKLFDLFSVIKKINADVYVERTINPKIYLVGWWCRLFKKKFIYMVAHDWDCAYPSLKLADLIIAQNQQQKLALKQKLGLESIVMQSLIKIKSWGNSLNQKYILWVGRADEWKKPLDLIELARRYPKEQFVMICRQGNNIKLFRQVKISAESLPNIKFISAVREIKILNFFRQAKILVNTSLAEGFPNTFLQAGATRVPILSFKVNPDNYIIKYRCGLVGSNRLKLMLVNPSKLKIMGDKHYNYVKKHHSFRNLNVFKQAIKELF